MSQNGLDVESMLPLRRWWFIALFAYSFLFAGIWAMLYAITEAPDGLASRGWPTALGTVTTSRLIEPGPGSYTTEIRYVYRVDGMEYRGSRVRQSDLIISNRAAVQAIVDRYPVGSEVQVHYYPKNPQNSLLEPGFAFDLLIPLGVGAVLSTLGALMARWLMRFVRNNGAGVD